MFQPTRLSWVHVPFQFNAAVPQAVIPLGELPALGSQELGSGGVLHMTMIFPLVAASDPVKSVLASDKPPQVKVLIKETWRAARETPAPVCQRPPSIASSP